MAGASTVLESLVTADELIRHPEWDPCELVKGKVVRMSPAGGWHGGITARIVGEICIYLKKRLMS